MHRDDKLIFCMLQKDNLWFMLNQRAGTPVKPKDYEGIRLYWAPKDIHETRERLKSLGYGVAELEDRDYGKPSFSSSTMTVLRTALASPHNDRYLVPAFRSSTFYPARNCHSLQNRQHRAARLAAFLLDFFP